MVKKSKSIEDKLWNSLSESGLGLVLESRRMQPGLILMKRGTLIPVHHFREVTSPNSGMAWVIAGIDPGRFARLYTGSAPDPWYIKLRDFYVSREWIPSRILVKRGFQDETGWSEPDEDGNYCADRDLVITRRFRKVLTMNRENIRTLEALPPGTDISQYEYKLYDDQKTWFRRMRVRGERMNEPIE